MSKLHAQQTSVVVFLSDSADILIPDYQRPYSWGEKHLSQMWDDFVDYALPDDSDPSQFDPDSYYFMGAIVAFGNGGNQEIVDGQQRLTSLILLLRAYSCVFAAYADPAPHVKSDAQTALGDAAEPSFKWERVMANNLNSVTRCIWRPDDLGLIDHNSPLKFKTDAAGEDDQRSLKGILRDGICRDDDASNYASAFRYFLRQIKELNKKNPESVHYLFHRVLNNVILLPIVTGSQETALDLFSTINDRGMPLYDSDIFKTKIFNFYKKNGKFEGVSDRWKRMEENCEVFPHGDSTSDVDELFKIYMHYSLAKNGVMGNHRESMRNYFGSDARKTLESEEVFEDLELLSKFWVQTRYLRGFSEPSRRLLYVLSFSPYDSWIYVLSAFYLRRHRAGRLSDADTTDLLEWVASFMVGGCVELLTPRKAYDRLYEEIVNIVWQEGKYPRYRFSAEDLKQKFLAMHFMEKKKHVAFLLAWWTFWVKSQPLPDNNVVWEVEQLEGDPKTTGPGSGSLWSLGNRVLLESGVKKKIPNRSVRFADKKSFYMGGYSRRGGTANAELLGIVRGGVFGKAQIERRNALMFESIIDALRKHSYLEEP